MKQIKYLFVMMIATFIFVACRQPLVSPIPYTNISIKLIDKEGNSLVGTPLYGDSIKAYRNNGEKVYCHVFDKEVRVNIAGIGTAFEERTVSTYIQWNSKDVDTITATLGRHAAFYVYDKVYYNDSLVIQSYKQVVYSSEPNYNGGKITIVK